MNNCFIPQSLGAELEFYYIEIRSFVSTRNPLHIINFTDCFKFCGVQMQIPLAAGIVNEYSIF